MTMTNERVRPGQYPRQSTTLASEIAIKVDVP
ncbi:hypothetical protein SUDANB180_02454 [Streptomyces sp. enrichment culture]